MLDFLKEVGVVHESVFQRQQFGELTRATPLWCELVGEVFNILVAYCSQPDNHFNMPQSV